MAKIDWYNEVLKRKDQLLSDTKGLLKIKSVLEEDKATEEAPFGPGPKEALDYVLKLGEEAGFTAKNVDNYAGHLEMGQGEELVGVLGHVDVVPEGDGWTYDPYGAEIHDGKLYARGSADDKGPTMAAFYGMKIVKELGLPLTKRVRLIIGTDEESGMRCVEHYFKHEEMPDLGFVPDADFPIIHAEKGIASVNLLFNNHVGDNEHEYLVEKFESGRRYNMVPDYAEAVISYKENPESLTEQFATYLKENNLQGETSLESGKVVLSVRGKSAHAMEPDHGVNAGLYLSSFLADQTIDGKANGYFSFIKEMLFNDSRANKLKINYRDDVSGDLTMNVALFSYNHDNGGKVGLNFRYPVTYDYENALKTLNEVVSQHGFSVEAFENSKPLYVEKDSPLIKALSKVYEEQTGDKAELLSIGGGTYARHLETGVAFGAMFPGREDVMHQKDEYMYVEDLLKATAIYAQAIYELAK